MDAYTILGCTGMFIVGMACGDFYKTDSILDFVVCVGIYLFGSIFVFFWARHRINSLFPSTQKPKTGAEPVCNCILGCSSRHELFMELAEPRMSRLPSVVVRWCGAKQNQEAVEFTFWVWAVHIDLTMGNLLLYGSHDRTFTRLPEIDSQNLLLRCFGDKRLEVVDMRTYDIEQMAQSSQPVRGW